MDAQCNNHHLLLLGVDAAGGRACIFLSSSLFPPLCTLIVPLSAYSLLFSSLRGGGGIGGCNSHENGPSLPGPQGPTRFELHLVVAAHVAVHSFLHSGGGGPIDTTGSRHWHHPWPPWRGPSRPPALGAWSLLGAIPRAVALVSDAYMGWLPYLGRGGSDIHGDAWTVLHAI